MVGKAKLQVPHGLSTTGSLYQLCVELIEKYGVLVFREEKKHYYLYTMVSVLHLSEDTDIFAELHGA